LKQVAASAGIDRHGAFGPSRQPVRCAPEERGEREREERGERESVCDCVSERDRESEREGERERPCVCVVLASTVTALSLLLDNPSGVTPSWDVDLSRLTEASLLLRDCRRQAFSCGHSTRATL